MNTPMSTHIMPTAMLNTKPPSNHKIAAAIEASMSVRDFVSIMFAFQNYLWFDRAFSRYETNNTAMCRKNVHGK